MHSFRLFSLALAILVFPIRGIAQGLGWDYQEQARSHTTDLQHVEMHISFDEPAKKFMGTVLETMAILPQKDPVNEIVLDAVNLNIEKVWLDEGNGRKLPLTFNTNDSAKLHITLDRVHPWSVPFTIGIQYWGQNPKKGLYFMAPDLRLSE